ncbi:protein ALP1-like [Aphis craccivora]|uniref:Protein ALP1-like n=1 Tax=Aphis craccivora TaxID=307492 RepID=A0A6G0YEB5_APHCR|nr:protein ALP1-like [Aphis craccivora]
MPEPTKEKWLEIAELYSKVTNFPNCIGAIDGKNIQVVKPVGT